ERAVRASGPLLENLPEPDLPSPLQPMNHEERLVADFHGTGLTVGPHPMAYRRDWLTAMGIRRAIELRDLPTGKRLRIGGCVITRQRPGTAKGFVFLSLEDETGVANAIVTPDLFHQNRLLLASERFVAVEGILQNQDNVISVKAERVLPLFVTKAETVSHDFHYTTLAPASRGCHGGHTPERRALHSSITSPYNSLSKSSSTHHRSPAMIHL